MKKGMLVKGIVSTVVAMTSLNAFAGHDEATLKAKAKELCAAYDSSVTSAAGSTINKYVKGVTGYSCLDVSGSASPKEPSMDECITQLNNSCYNTLGYNWERSDFHDDAKCMIIKDGSGKKEVIESVGVYSLKENIITSYPTAAEGKKCGQLQMKIDKKLKLTSVSKFGSGMAFAAGGRLFKMSEVTTASGNGAYVVYEINNQEGQPYKTVVKVAEASSADTVTVTRNNKQSFDIEKKDLTPSSGRLTKVGHAKVESRNTSEVMVKVVEK